MNNKQRLALAVSFLVFALFLGALLILEKRFPVIPETARNALWVIVVVAVIIGPLIALGFKRILPRRFRLRSNASAVITRRAGKHQLPGFFAPAFQLLDEKLALTVTPCADPMTPMYMLDRNFRIIDWNLAFSMCFDRTMEGRRGRNVLEWTYFLDNYEEALTHGIAVFGEGKDPPRIDIEELSSISDRYGQINGTKRAYQIPDDDGSCLGWPYPDVDTVVINPPDAPDVSDAPIGFQRGEQRAKICQIKELK